MTSTVWFEFSPDGPHDFSAHVTRNTKGVKQLDLKGFKRWLAGLSLADEKGVYIFATGASKPKPWYVGCTTDQSFLAECGAKEAMTNKVLQIGHGAALVFALKAPAGRSRPLKRAITELETEMIRWCYRLNPRLLNDRKKHPDFDTFIRGVLRNGAGKPSASASALRKVLKIA